MRATWAIGLLAAWACGCAPRPDTFACSADAQCVDGPHQGACEPSGWCSFPDLECDSDRRYGPLAAPELAGMCVPIDEATGDGSGSSSGDPSSTSPVTSNGTDATSTMPQDTTSAVDDSSSGDDGTGPPSACNTYVDDFEDEAIGDEWEAWDDIDTEVAEQDGRIEFVLGVGDEWRTAGVRQVASDLRGTTVRAQFSQPEGLLDDAVEVWLSVGDTSTCSLEVGIRGDRVTAFARLDAFDGGPLAAMQPMWMQLRIDADSVVHWEVLRDGAWEAFHQQESPCDLSSATVQLWAGAQPGLDDEVVRGIEEFARCGP